MKNLTLLSKVLIVVAVGTSFSSFAQTNVFDDVIVPSPDHTYLEQALIQEGLDGALQDVNATLTVFAPTNQAFDDIAAALNTDINGLLALPNLDDILLYHVLGIEVPSSGVTNGTIAQPLSATNTLKLTLTSNNEVFVNQAQVTTADLTTDNGVVHVTNAVLLPVETVVDIAIDNSFTSLTAAVIQEELLPVLTNPLGTFTVFAPTDQAFDDLATALNTDVTGILALPNLTDVLTYHVLGAVVNSGDITNGDIAQPVSATNSLKLTVTSNAEVFVNQAQVSLADLSASNGVVHVLDAVVLPVETVVDVALDNGFTSLAAAVIQAELLPALTDPLAKFTVFAPTNQAFDDLATALNTDINGLLALPNLGDILLYHVVGSEVFAMDLMNGTVATLNGESVLVDLTSDVMINDATVTLADVAADNGVVHVIDRVLDPSTASINDLEKVNISIYPNPASDFVQVEGTPIESLEIISMTGAVVRSSNSNTVQVSGLPAGTYFVQVNGNKYLAETIQVVAE